MAQPLPAIDLNPGIKSHGITGVNGTRMPSPLEAPSRDMYSPRHDPVPEMIPISLHVVPEMIPNFF